MEYRITLEQANRQTARYILWPVLLLAAAVFIARLPHWDFSFWRQAHVWGLGPWLLRYVMWLLIFVAALLVGVFVHEGLHGVAIVLLARGGWRSLEFGFDRKTLSPFAHSRVPLRAWQMTVVCLAPLVGLGLLPAVAAVMEGSVFVYALSVIFIVASGGDMLYVGMLARYAKGRDWVRDLPDAVGFSLESPGKEKGKE